MNPFFFLFPIKEHRITGWESVLSFGIVLDGNENSQRIKFVGKKKWMRNSRTKHFSRIEQARYLVEDVTRRTTSIARYLIYSIARRKLGREISRKEVNRRLSFVIGLEFEEFRSTERAIFWNRACTICKIGKRFHQIIGLTLRAYPLRSYCLHVYSCNHRNRSIHPLIHCVAAIGKCTIETDITMITSKGRNLTNL